MEKRMDFLVLLRQLIPPSHGLIFTNHMFKAQEEQSVLGDVSVKVLFWKNIYWIQCKPGQDNAPSTFSLHFLVMVL
jgi:hypothetical protein